MSKLRKLSLITVFFCLILFVYAYSINSADILRPTGYEAVTVDNTAGGVPLTTSKYWASSKIVSDYAIVILEAAPIRFTVDGTTVTSSAGMPLLPYQSFVLRTFDELKNFRAIRIGDASGSLKVTYYKLYRN